jgi:hypothetical protein
VGRLALLILGAVTLYFALLRLLGLRLGMLLGRKP